MKILIISDFHYPTFKDIENIISINKKDIDLIIYLGDNDEFLVEEVSFHFRDIKQIGVLGNHDYSNIYENSIIENINNKIIVYNNIKFLGIEGSVKEEKEDCFGYTQEGLIPALKGFDGVDIVISHNSPYGVHEVDRYSHIGYKGLYDYIIKNNPLYCFHGHQHIDIESKLNNTIIKGIYKYKIIEI